MATPDESAASADPPDRAHASVLQAKAASHPLRLRILRLCADEALTNKELSDRLHSSPGTTVYHVRLLVQAGLLEQAPIRTGAGGALEKPYYSTGLSWWLSDDDDFDSTRSMASIQAFEEELREAGPGSVRTSSRFALHLSREQLDELSSRIMDVLDEYIATDDQRLDQPALGGIFVLHQLADPQMETRAGNPQQS